MGKKSISQVVLPDIFVWAIVFFLPIYFSPTPAHHRPEQLSIVRYLPYISSFLFIMAIYYFNYHVLVPRLYIRRRYLAYSLSILLALWLLIFAPELDHLFESHEPPLGLRKAPARISLISRAFDFSYFEMQVFILGISAIAVSTFLRVTRKLREVEDQKVVAELAYLKAQINPHFLFNTLNSIYSLAYKKSELTAPAIVKLSGLMRYAISEAKHELVPLEKEMENISNYVELQRLRLPAKATLKYIMNGDAEGKLIPPLILLPFIENAFKYGVNPEKESAVSIEFMLTTHTLKMDITNTIVSTPDMPSERIGIGNSRERLEQYYPNHHQLEIHQTPDLFEVSLKVDFT